jgi:hypothetical protein
MTTEEILCVTVLNSWRLVINRFNKTFSELSDEQLDEPYIANPDRVLADPLSATELRRAWAEVNDKLTRAFEGFTLED